MSIQQSETRILTTHVGSLPRPTDLLDLMKRRFSEPELDRSEYEERVRSAVAECVQQQAAVGIDILTDGEQSKPGFSVYVQERLEGFEARPDQKQRKFRLEREAFPEYYDDYFKRAMGGGSVAPGSPMACVGPIRYRGQAALRQDIDNLKAAAVGVEHHAVFMPAIAPSGVGTNEYYPNEEDFFHAVGAALRVEYQGIVDAGFQVQIDDPYLTDVFVDPSLEERQRHRRASLHVEAINASLEGIPPEKVRYHTCYGINEGPRVHEAALAEVVEYMLKVNAGAYSFEAANARHEHEYHLWENVRLPEGKVLMPGVLFHASNIVEHPEWIAERLMRFAALVGRENVVAGTDCGFSSQAAYHTEVHPTVVWAKFEALRDGARLASKRLWP
jgi:5-methyltetrahydropteroyltriglutamate--homocysteine methyltransferase